MGWHYSVQKGRPRDLWGNGFIEITTGCGSEYTAWVQTTPQFIVRHKDPKRALRLAVKAFDVHLANLARVRKLVDETLTK